MKKGDLVKVWGSYSTIDQSDLVRGWQDDPGVYNHHKAIWVTNGMMGIILQKIDERCRVLVSDRIVWLYDYQLQVIK